MRGLFVVGLTMLAFAANSLLNRAALEQGQIDSAGFALLRLLSGTVMLLLLLALRGKLRVRAPDPAGVLSLSAYMLGFSFAYVELNAGFGALILFGGVQLTMFVGALRGGEDILPQRWVGMVLALVGLAVLVWPDTGAVVPPVAVAMMAVAAVGWGVYSLRGRNAGDPLSATAWNFAYAVPIAAVAFAIAQDGTGTSAQGVLLAVLSGAFASGLGYALWYSVLPGLGPTRAALVQLSVPVLALFAGYILLGEAVGLRALLACAMILGGIACGVVQWPFGRR